MLNIKTATVGTDLRTCYTVWGDTASRLLQWGCPTADVASLLRGVRDDSAGRLDLPDGSTVEVGSLWDAIGRTLEDLTNEEG
jgi:hypothetical protein